MWLDVDFGSGKTGLATVGYRQFNNIGGDAVARTTTGVVEIGQGAYGADVTINAAAVGVEWDTGEGTPVYAHENFFAGGFLHAPDAIEAGLHLQASLRGMSAASCGKTAGPPPREAGTVTVRDAMDSKTRITATVDENGYRTGVVLDTT